LTIPGNDRGVMPRLDAMVGTNILTPATAADAAMSYRIKDGSQLPWVEFPGEGSRTSADSLSRVS
jgi:hypothetical protein